MKKGRRKNYNIFFRPINFIIGALVLVFFAVFLSVATPSILKYKTANAQVVVDISCDCMYCVSCAACPTSGSTNIVETLIEEALDAIQEAVEQAIEEFIRNIVDTVIGGFLTNANDAEENLKDWWQQLWEYDMKPAFQKMTAQLNTGRVDQTRAMGSAFDGQNFTFVQSEIKTNEVEASHNSRPSEAVCMAATQAAGFTRANAFVRAVRFGMEDENNKTGLNQVGTLNADGRYAVHSDIWGKYTDLFCNNQSNKGATCAVSGAMPDADIRPTATLLAPLTIDLKDNNTRIATETAIDHLAGVDVISPIRPGAVNTTAGHDLILDRRERLAKRAAARSVNTLSTLGWRSRGSDMALWVNEFNLKTGSNIVVSNDPSYHEVMHALTKYKFLSGHYGGEQVSGGLNAEREKLISSSLYLMHLRDYYELLERVTLAAAVDTSIELDGYGQIGNSLASVSKR